MNKTTILLIAAQFVVAIALGQQPPPPQPQSAAVVMTAEEAAQKLAQRLQDSLGLSVQQRQKLFAIHKRMNGQKTAARAKYKGDIAATQKALQDVENTKDSLYREVLSENEFRLYQQKKRNIIKAGM